jgi:hypothetical protein
MNHREAQAVVSLRDVMHFARQGPIIQFGSSALASDGGATQVAQSGYVFPSNAPAVGNTPAGSCGVVIQPSGLVAQTRVMFSQSLYVTPPAAPLS